MEGSRKKAWVVMFSVFLTVLVGIAVFWDAVGIRIAPKIVLRAAIQDVVTQLEVRFSDHPLKILADTLDENGRYDAEMKLGMENDVLGEITYDMDAQMDFNFHRFLAEGTVSAGVQPVDLSVYMDRFMLSVQSGQFANPEHFGIRYDSFLSDIRNFPLLSVFVKDHTFSKWDNGLRQIKEAMHVNVLAPQIPTLSQELIDGLLLGVLMLPCEVEKESCWLDQKESCYRISYHLDEEEIASILDVLGEGLNGELCSLRVSFCLYRNSLIQVDVELETVEGESKYTVTLMQDASEGKAGLQGLVRRKGETREFAVFAASKTGQNHISESWEICSDFEGTKPASVFAYTWNKNSGEMELSLAEAEPVYLVFRKTEEGLYVSSFECKEIGSFFLREKKETSKWIPIWCEMNITKGSSVAVPECKFLNSWSLEELLQLLSVIGPLLGWDLS